MGSRCDCSALKRTSVRFCNEEEVVNSDDEGVCTIWKERPGNARNCISMYNIYPSLRVVVGVAKDSRVCPINNNNFR